MKKILFALSAFAVLFAVGCSKEDVDIPAPEYKLVVNMDKPSFGNDTRAPRSSWEDGDKVVVVFNGDIQDGKYLILTYNATDNSWSPEWNGTTAADVAAKGEKQCLASYHSLGVGTPYVQSSGSLIVPSATMNVGSSNPLNNLGGCVMLCNDGTYTVDNDVITLNITMKPKCAQYTVRNISTQNGELWKLSVKTNSTDSTWKVFTGVSFSTTLGVQVATLGNSDEMYGHKNRDGVAFFGNYTRNKKEFTFTLTNGTDTYTRVFNKSIVDGAAVIMDGPTDGDLNGWTDVTPAP